MYYCHRNQNTFCCRNNANRRLWPGSQTSPGNKPTFDLIKGNPGMTGIALGFGGSRVVWKGEVSFPQGNFLDSVSSKVSKSVCVSTSSHISFSTAIHIPVTLCRDSMDSILKPLVPPPHSMNSILQSIFLLQPYSQYSWFQLNIRSKHQQELL